MTFLVPIVIDASLKAAGIFLLAALHMGHTEQHRRRPASGLVRGGAGSLDDAAAGLPAAGGDVAGQTVG